MNWERSEFEKEITFKTSRSGGKGGQNVNKVSTKAELNLDIIASSLFTKDQKEVILQKLRHRINKNGILQVICEEERSQLLNKQRCLEKLVFLITNAFLIKKRRKPTKPTKGSVENRLKGKLAQSIKKINRSKHGEDF